MEAVGRGLNIDIDYLNLVGSMVVPRLTVELNLEKDDVPKLIEGCDIDSHPSYEQKYRIIIEEVKLLNKDGIDNLANERYLYDVTEDDVKVFKKIAEEELKKRGF